MNEKAKPLVVKGWLIVDKKTGDISKRHHESGLYFYKWLATHNKSKTRTVVRGRATFEVLE